MINSFSEYQQLMEGAGNLAGLPPAWIALLKRKGVIGENSEITAAEITTKSWSALTGAVKKVLTEAENGNGTVGVAIYIEDVPALLAVTDTNFSTRPKFMALTGDGKAIQQRVALQVRDWEAENAYRMRQIKAGYKPHTHKINKTVWRDSSDHTKSELVDRLAFQIGNLTGIDVANGDKTPVTFTVKAIKVDKNRVAVAAQRRENRSTAAVPEERLKARAQLVKKKLESSPELQKHIDAWNAFMGSKLTIEEFVDRAEGDDQFKIDHHKIKEFTEAAQNLGRIAHSVRSSLKEPSYNPANNSSWKREEIRWLDSILHPSKN